jgi:hypothetical protein
VVREHIPMNAGELLDVARRERAQWRAVALALIARVDNGVVVLTDDELERAAAGQVMRSRSEPLHTTTMVFTAPERAR